MSGSLYQKPGKDSTEWLATKIAGIAGGVVAVGGAPVMHWVNWKEGAALMAAGSLVVAVTLAAYSHGRSMVKAAAEANRPPVSRVV